LEWIALICIIFLSGRHFKSVLLWGHSNIIFLCVLTAVLWAHHRDRPWLAGILLGVSVIFKPMPLILVPLFLLKRHYKTVVATLAMLLGLVLFSVFLMGGSVIGQWVSNIKTFHDYAVYHPFQLSATSLVHKLLGMSYPSLAYWLGASAMVVLYVISLFICGRHRGSLRAGEYALVVALIPISTPYVQSYHFNLLAIPLLVAAHILIDRGERFPGFRWGVFTEIWLTWALGFYFNRWSSEGIVGLKALLGYVPLFTAIGLWGFLLSSIGIQPAQRIMKQPAPKEASLIH
jgi:Gpi18-like mannosyltransferase